MLTLKNIIKGSIFLGLVLALNACVVSPRPHGYYSDPYSHSSMVYWYYYPNYGVYYHPVDHYYYYQIGGVWRRDNRLPSGWVLSGEPRVRMQLSGVPYQKYSDHRRHYPPRRVINVMPHNRSDNGDRRDHRHRPDRDDRPGSGNGNSRERRSDMDRKEGRNIFVPHPQDKRIYDKRERMENSDQSGKKGSYKGENKSLLKTLKQGTPYKGDKPQGKAQLQKQKSEQKSRQDKDYKKGKQKYDDEEDEQENEKPRNKNYKDRDRRKDWYKDR